MCLLAYARLALAMGDAERAALLVGVTEGLRRRAGVRGWTSLREAALTDRIRQALGPQRFDRAYGTGSEFNRDEAVAAIRGGQEADATVS